MTVKMDKYKIRTRATLDHTVTYVVNAVSWEEAMETAIRDMIQEIRDHTEYLCDIECDEATLELNI